MEISIDFSQNMLKFGSRNEGRCAQDVGSRNLEGQGADEKVGLVQYAFCQVVFTIRMELDMARKFVLQARHHQAGQAEAAGTDDADDDFAGKGFFPLSRSRAAPKWMVR